MMSRSARQTYVKRKQALFFISQTASSSVDLCIGVLTSNQAVRSGASKFRRAPAVACLLVSTTKWTLAVRNWANEILCSVMMQKST